MLSVYKLNDFFNPINRQPYLKTMKINTNIKLPLFLLIQSAIGIKASEVIKEIKEENKITKKKTEMQKRRKIND